MNNELLEQWRKEAEDKGRHYIQTPDANKGLYSLKPLQWKANYEDGYIEGCKATHEKMLKLVEKAFNVINPSAITWDYFKKENNIS